MRFWKYFLYNEKRLFLFFNLFFDLSYKPAFSILRLICKVFKCLLVEIRLEEIKIFFYYLMLKNEATKNFYDLIDVQMGRIENYTIVFAL